MTHTYSNHNAASHGALQRSKKAAAATTDATRTRYIKAIKAKQRQLGLDEPTYRAMLLARTGKTSCKDCTLIELGNVSGYLTAQGATNPKGLNADGRKRLATPPDRQALMGKVKALLAELHQVTGTPYTLAYADAICERNRWCTRVDFADAHILHRLVGALSHTVTSKTHTANDRPCHG